VTSTTFHDRYALKPISVFEESKQGIWTIDQVKKYGWLNLKSSRLIEAGLYIVNVVKNKKITNPNLYYCLGSVEQFGSMLTRSNGQVVEQMKISDAAPRTYYLTLFDLL
jgi:hypothetical protein